MAESERRSRARDDDELADEGAVEGKGIVEGEAAVEGEGGEEEEEEGELEEGEEVVVDVSGRRPTRRRAERIAKAQEVRRRRNLRRAAIAVLIASVIVLASLLAYVYWPEKPTTVTVTTSTGTFEVEWSGKSNPIVSMATTMGTIRLEIFMDKTPQTAGNFKHLVEKGFYNGLLFHRVIADFMIQGGDPSGDGTGGPGYTINFEQSAGELKHVRGTLAMARSTDKNSAGSQFYICVTPQTTLDGQYAVFGKVVSGMDVVDSISTVATDTNDKPYTNIQMTDVHMASD